MANRSEMSLVLECMAVDNIIK